jgi:hypothetical protein
MAVNLFVSRSNRPKHPRLCRTVQPAGFAFRYLHEMESFLILKCFSTAAQTISLVMLDVPGMHLSVSVVHSMNVLFSLVRGSGRAASPWAWTAIRQPMTVKAEAHRSAWLTVIAVPPASSSIERHADFLALRSPVCFAPRLM